MDEIALRAKQCLGQVLTSEVNTFFERKKCNHKAESMIQTLVLQKFGNSCLKSGLWLLATLSLNSQDDNCKESYKTQKKLRETDSSMLLDLICHDM